jgi:hypothetical protein
MMFMKSRNVERKRNTEGLLILESDYKSESGRMFEKVLEVTSSEGEVTSSEGKITLSEGKVTSNE